MSCQEIIEDVISVGFPTDLGLADKKLFQSDTDIGSDWLAESDEFFIELVVPKI